MKRIFTLTLLALVAIIGSITACAYTYRTSDYYGKLDVDLTSMGMTKYTTENQKVSLTPTTYGYCTIDIHDFTFMGKNVGDIVLDNVSLKDGDDGGFKLSGSQKDVKLADGDIIVDVTLDGTDSVDGELSLDVTIVWNGVNIPVSFDGEYGEEDGISSIGIDDSTPSVYYTLNGTRVNGAALCHGLYIVRQGNMTSKVMIH